MERTVGTIARGIRTPIVKEGDDVIAVVVDSVLKAIESEQIVIRDRDVVGITESLVARAQGNFASVDDIQKAIEQKFSGDSIVVVFPILSRNRFSVILKGIAATGKKVKLLLSYPADEVGNHIITLDQLDQTNLNPLTDLLTEEAFRQHFGRDTVHRFTGIDYIEMYKEISPNIEVYFGNQPRMALELGPDILVAEIHNRARTKRILRAEGGRTVFALDDILTEPIDGSGYNENYGLLGSNLASTTELKLFPRNGAYYVNGIQQGLQDATGKIIEVLIYGDGAFKDPVGQIWELADPVVSPAFTEGLCGTPNELKLKYIADTELKGLSSAESTIAMRKKIYAKATDQLNDQESLGTTPRQITDLLGSLCDLVSGSGDKGTPVVLIQGYFDNYASE